MGLETIVKAAVASAKSITASLQATITLEPFSTDDAYGSRTYGAAVSYEVVIEHRDRFVTAQDRTQQLSQTQIQFLEAVQVKHQDRITLPDGTKPQILAVEGVLDPDGNLYAPKVFF